MFVPIPVLIAAGVVFLLLIGWIARLSRRRDPLLGGGPAAAYRPSPAARLVPAGTASGILPPDVEVQVRALLAAGRKIEAIKIARDATHLGLKETKDLVEALE